jgi:activator of HSP90 ATPase
MRGFGDQVDPSGSHDQGEREESVRRAHRRKAVQRVSGGAPAEIDAQEGGSFYCFGGHIKGRNIELVPGKRVVQAWRSVKWREGVYSIVRFELSEEGGSTKIVFDQAGFPEEAGPHLEGGWAKMYWEPLKAYLAEAVGE